MKTSELVKQGENIQFIASHYNLPPINPKKHYKGECPVCNAKNKFRFHNKNGGGEWICTCGHGNIWKLLEASTGKTFKELARAIDELLGNTIDYTPKPRDNRIRDALNLFANAKETLNTNVHEYLLSREIISQPSSNAVRNLNGNMLAIVTDINLKPVYTHTTYLLSLIHISEPTRPY